MFLRNQKGIALISVLIILTVASLLGTTVYFANSQETFSAERDENQTQAYYYARSGVEMAMDLIEKNIDNLNYWREPVQFYGNIDDKAFSNIPTGDYSINFGIEFRDDEDKFYIKSTGIVRNAGTEGTQAAASALGFSITRKKVVECIDDNNTNKTYPNIKGENGQPWALFSKEDIILSRTPSISGDVGTNLTKVGRVSFTPNGTKIKGQLYVGFDALNPTAIVSHPSYTILSDHITQLPIKKLSSYRDYPMPIFPPFPDTLVSRPDFKTPWVSGLYYEINNDGHYNLIEATSGRTITFDLGSGDRKIRVKNLNIDSGNIVLKNTGDNGRLIIYVEDNFTFADGRINEGGDPNRLIIYYRGSNNIDISGSQKFVGSLFVGANDPSKIPANITVGGSCEFTGTIISGGETVTVEGGSQNAVRGLLYAPNAHVQVKSSAVVTGSVISKRCTLSGGSSDLIIANNNSLDTRFFNLLEWETTGESGEPTDKNWRKAGKWIKE